MAQMNTGKISGAVVDQSGAALTGASVRATEDGTGVSTETHTTERGEYLLNFLLPGTYTVEVEIEGFQKSVTSAIAVTAGGNAHMQVSLKIGKTNEVVQIEANSIAVATKTSELSQTFSAKDLDTLPISIEIHSTN